MFPASIAGLLGFSTRRESEPSEPSDDDPIHVFGRDVGGAGRASCAKGPTPARKLISLGGGKLDRVQIPTLPKADRKLRVIIILGKARMGKSTFLNCVAAQAIKGSWSLSQALNIAGRDDPTFVPPFATSAEEEHCTKGIDSFLLTAEATGRSEDILLLDCQGLAMDDSSMDPALLLAAYLLGDLLIFNEQGQLKNDALKLLEPMPAFISKLEGLDSDSKGVLAKPALMFRMADVDRIAGRDAQANVERVLQYHPDHYQSIRDSLQSMFSSVKGVRTRSLDRSEKEALTQGDGVAGMLALLAPGSDSGFRAAVEAVLSSGVPRRTAAQWATLVPSVVSQINSGDKISLKMLDVVKLSGQVDMLEFIGKINPHLFTDIEVDHTQATYDARVKPRVEACDSVLQQFTSRFKLLGQRLREEQIGPLNSRFGAPVDRAIAAATAAATSFAEPHRVSVQRDKPDLLLLTHTTNAAISQQMPNARAALASHLRPLRDALTGLFKPVADPLATWADEQEKRLAAALQWYEKEETATAKAAGKEVAAITKAYPGNLVAAVKDIPLRCEDELLMDRATQLRRVVEQVAMGSSLWKAGATANWLYVDISGGGVRVLAGAFKSKRGRSDLRIWRPSAISLGGSWAVVDPMTRTVLDPVVASAESQLRSRGFDVGAEGERINAPIYRDLFGGNLPRDHALLGKVSALVIDTLLPTIQLRDFTGAQFSIVAANGAVHTAMDSAVDDAMFGLYEEIGGMHDGIDSLRLHLKGAEPLLLRVTSPDLHPRLKLATVDLRDAAEVSDSRIPIMLMTERSFNSHWLNVFQQAAQAVVDDKAAVDKQRVLDAAVKFDELSNNRNGPRAAVKRLYLDRALLPGGSHGWHRWTQRGGNARPLLPELFLAKLKSALAADDDRKSDDRIFRFWRQLGDEMAERARAREAGASQ